MSTNPTRPRDPMEVVRMFFERVNRGDLDAIVASYDDECVLERVFTDDDSVREGVAAAREGWASEVSRWRGGLPGGHRVSVAAIAGMETGWGWVRAEWIASLVDARNDASDEPRISAGHSHFWIEDGRIQRQRNVSREVAKLTESAASASQRTYPTRPIVGVGAAVLDADGRVAMVKRRYEPLAGQWSLPGGVLELGESLQAGTAREILEETGLVVTVGAVIDVFDRILVDEAGRVQYHFVLVDYLCSVRGGTLAAASDVADVAWADPGDLAPFRLTGKVLDVIAHAVRMRGTGAC